MGRRKKQADIEEAIVESEQTEARKNSELTADERRALHFRHCAEYERALQVKKLADAGLKNVGKRIKAESDSVAKCKQTIQARTPQGEAELRAEIEQTLEVLLAGRCAREDQGRRVAVPVSVPRNEAASQKARRRVGG
jgi:hypothetical protein